MRTSSEPARARAATWAAVASTSAVSVLVIDCTAMGASPPTVTPPTLTGIERRRVRLSITQGYITFVEALPASATGLILRDGRLRALLRMRDFDASWRGAAEGRVSNHEVPAPWRGRGLFARE